MIDRNCSLPHELVCATNDAVSLNSEIRIAPVEHKLIHIGCAFPKLAIFRPDAAQIFGKRICLIDLDVVITGSLDRLVGRSESFVIWKDVLAKSQPKRFKYNSSMILMDAGAKSQVWEALWPDNIKKILHREYKWCGSDQAWISHMLDNEVTWSAADGVLSWRFEVEKKPEMPEPAKIIFYHGKDKPWMMPNHPIVKRHWN